MRSAAARAEALAAVVALAEELGLRVGGLERSPVTGGSGNIEYLLWLRPSSGASGMMDWGLTSDEVRARCGSLRSEEER